MFSIDTSSGKAIRDHSYFQQEDEIILPPGRYFRVIDQSSPAQDLHIIHLREIVPPHPMLTDPFDLSELRKTLSPPLSFSFDQNQENAVVPTAPLQPSSLAASHEGKFTPFILTLSCLSDVGAGNFSFSLSLAQR
jgi:hypothetical protein